jgi:integrase
VDELRALLEAAAAQAPDVLPVLASGAFAGLRDAEIKRLDWSEVDLARGFIEVKAAKAKSARRRIVAIQTNLAAWLSQAPIGLRQWPPSAKGRAQQACSGP